MRHLVLFNALLFAVSGYVALRYGQHVGGFLLWGVAALCAWFWIKNRKS
jgi:hypothetical protein